MRIHFESVCVCMWQAPHMTTIIGTNIMQKRNETPALCDLFSLSCMVYIVQRIPYRVFSFSTHSMSNKQQRACRGKNRKIEERACVYRHWLFCAPFFKSFMYRCLMWQHVGKFVTHCIIIVDWKFCALITFYRITSYCGIHFEHVLSVTVAHVNRANTKKMK